MARSTLSPSAVPPLSTTVPLPFRGEQMRLHGRTPHLVSSAGSSPPHASTDSTRVSSREARDFAPLMCNKKRQLSHAQQETPRAGAPGLAPSSPAAFSQLGSVCSLLRSFFSPGAEELLAAAGLLCWHEMTDVSLHLCAHQLNKLPQQQHVLAGISVSM